jgi:hypothetical protein
MTVDMYLVTLRELNEDGNLRLDRAVTVIHDASRCQGTLPRYERRTGFSPESSPSYVALLSFARA